MKWHLVAPSGGIVRTCEAESIGEARFRLAPIRPDHRVLSAASYADAPTTPPKAKDASKARTITPEHRLAIARGNTRRMLTRKYGWTQKPKPRRNPEVRSRINKAYRERQVEADPQYDAKLREARRREAVVRYAHLLPDVLRGVERGESDATMAERTGYGEDTIRDIREGFKLPSAQVVRRQRITALTFYYRAQGWTETRIHEYTGASRKMLRTIPRTLGALIYVG